MPIGEGVEALGGREVSKQSNNGIKNDGTLSTAQCSQPTGGHVNQTGTAPTIVTGQFTVCSPRSNDPICHKHVLTGIGNPMSKLSLLTAENLSPNVAVSEEEDVDEHCRQQGIENLHQGEEDPCSLPSADPEQQCLSDSDDEFVNYGVSDDGVDLSVMVEETQLNDYESPYSQQLVMGMHWGQQAEKNIVDLSIQGQREEFNTMGRLLGIQSFPHYSGIDHIGYTHHLLFHNNIEDVGEIRSPDFKVTVTSAQVTSAQATIRPISAMEMTPPNSHSRVFINRRMELELRLPKCWICRNDNTSVECVFLPCGHGSCRSCSDRGHFLNQPCPFGRRIVLRILKIMVLPIH